MATTKTPTVNDDQSAAGPFLPVGTRVRYDGLEEGGPEFGVIVHCWMNEEIGGYDCYVAFFGNEFPTSGTSFQAAALSRSHMS
jgi:hypothetical protein